MNEAPNPSSNNAATSQGRGRWKRWVGWGITVVAIIFLLASSAVLLLLHSSKFHSYVLRLAVAKASASLGTTVSVRDFGIHWYGISPTIDLYDVAVQGRYVEPTREVLQVDHIQAEIRVTSLLSRTWYANEIVVTHPVVHIFVDKKGNNNLPTPQKSGKGRNTDIFDLGVRRVKVSNGEVYYNDQRNVLNADFRDFTFRSTFTTTQQNYSGSFGYRDGNLKFGPYSPVQHSLQADFAVNRQALTLKHAVLSVGSSQATLDATVSDYTNPKIDVRYNVEVTELHGESHLSGITLHDRTTGATEEIEPAAAFVFIGLSPNTGWLYKKRTGENELPPKG